MFGVGGDGRAHAVSTDALDRPCNRELLQATFEVAVLSLQLVLRVQSLSILLLKFLPRHKQSQCQQSLQLITFLIEENVLNDLRQVLKWFSVP